MQLIPRAPILISLAAVLLCGCTPTPEKKAEREMRAEVVRREVEVAPARPETSREEIMARTGEAQLMAKWVERMSSELAEEELTREIAHRAAEIENEQRLLASADSLHEREARDALSIRRQHLRAEQIGLDIARTASAQPAGAGVGLAGGPSSTGTAAMSSIYHFDRTADIEEIEQRARDDSDRHYARQRAEEMARCKRALKAMEALEEAGDE